MTKAEVKLFDHLLGYVLVSNAASPQDRESEMVFFGSCVVENCFRQAVKDGLVNQAGASQALFLLVLRAICEAQDGRRNYDREGAISRSYMRAVGIEAFGNLLLAANGCPPLAYPAKDTKFGETI